MAKKVERTQVNVRVSEEAVALLAALQEHYAEKAGLHSPVSQSQVIEALIHQGAEEANIKRGRK